MALFDKIFGKKPKPKTEPKPKPSEDTIRLIDSDSTEAVSEIFRLREFYKFVETNAKNRDDIDKIQWVYLWDNPIEHGFIPNKKFTDMLSQGGFTQDHIRHYCRWIKTPILSDIPVTKREAIGFIIKNCIADVKSGRPIEEKFSPFKEFVLATIAVREQMSKVTASIAGTKFTTTINYYPIEYDLYELADDWESFIHGDRWNYDINKYVDDKRKMNKR